MASKETRNAPGPGTVTDYEPKGKTVYTARRWHVTELEMTPPGKSPSSYSIINHVPQTLVLGVEDRKTLVMIRQWRFSIGKEGSWHLEIAGGSVEPGKDKDPAAAARREFEEETGITAERLVHLLDSYPLEAYVHTIHHFYLARTGAKSELKPDDDEAIDLVRIKVKDASRMLNNGEIPDAQAVLALGQYLRRRSYYNSELEIGSEWRMLSAMADIDKKITQYSDEPAYISRLRAMLHKVEQKIFG